MLFRSLPDKAIDLVDEAASRLRMEIDSMPIEIDELERRRIQLEIEREALRKESDERQGRRTCPEGDPHGTGSYPPAMRISSEIRRALQDPHECRDF